VATQYRKDASTVLNILLPRLPASKPSDWSEKSSFDWAKGLLRSLDSFFAIVHRIQDNGTDQPLRAKLNFLGASVTDDLTSDAIQVSIAGGAGAAPKNASYICVSLNGDLTAERTLFAGDGLTSTDSGAGANFTLQVGAGTGLNVQADVVNLANTAVTPTTYGDATHVGQFTVDQQGRLTAAAPIAITHPVPTVVGQAYIVSGLPAAPPQGTRAWVTDATAPVFLTPLVGLGGVVCPAFYDGTNWVAA
jgi:hypothetical protein